MSVHKLQLAGVSLARAREALGRLAAHPCGPLGGEPGDPPAEGAEQCLRVELGVLVESLRLSLAEGHKVSTAWCTQRLGTASELAKVQAREDSPWEKVVGRLVDRSCGVL